MKYKRKQDSGLKRIKKAGTMFTPTKTGTKRIQVPSRNESYLKEIDENDSVLKFEPASSEPVEIESSHNLN